MRQYPLAVYTAEHGLAWTYPREEIDFASLDGCRKAFGRLPDFDAGESGFEGVWVTPDRVFAVRCMSVQGWDFRGRDATYLAVTWVSRAEAQTTDFEALLASPALSEPTHAPQSFFMAYADCLAAAPLAPIPSELADLSMVGAVVATLPPAASAVLRRAAAGYSVQVRTMLPKVQQAATQTAYANAAPPSGAMSQSPFSMPARASGVSPLVFVGFGLFALALIGVVGLFMQNKTLHRENEALQEKVEERKEEANALLQEALKQRKSITDLQRQNKGLQKKLQAQTQAEKALWQSLEFPVPHARFAESLRCPWTPPKKKDAAIKQPASPKQRAEPKENPAKTPEEEPLSPAQIERHSEPRQTAELEPTSIEAVKPPVDALKTVPKSSPEQLASPQEQSPGQENVKEEVGQHPLLDALSAEP